MPMDKLFTNSVISKANFFYFLLVKEVSAIKDVRRLLHQVVVFGVVICFEDIPFGQDDNGMRSFYGLFGRTTLHQILSVGFFP